MSGKGSLVALVDAALRDVDAVEAVYQPIVELATGFAVGFEALARWLAALGVDVGAVFAAAKSMGTLMEVEWACRSAALMGALDAALGTQATLFVNVEPASVSLGWPPPPLITSILHRASTELRVVIEITERALLENPAALLATVSWARRHGCGIALDDVGANPNTVALLPFVYPDVIKLDAALVQDDLTRDAARTLAAVWRMLNTPEP
ncbi:EAL domain-containing protein [Rhodococcus sp. 14-2483-1-2]|uniref:EAL domain-containing protein n=1 Tax=Rhodococcus sp. 14-2483-1-2 TaxID=2023147 RepID=UPI000B9B0047|nr:EAL domain-containing protein [Rhodococcus sp. 14-2483-1-2]OZF26115.1 hypothetical protein CH295_26175 [Rhodococcus sp. 14-2483-1-2]